MSANTIHKIFKKVSDVLEHATYIETSEPLNLEQLGIIQGMIADTHRPKHTRYVSHFNPSDIVEIGPRLPIETPDSSNKVQICHNIGIPKVVRIEETRRYVLGGNQTPEQIIAIHLDRMTEQHYPTGIETFDTGVKPEPVKIADLIGGGKSVLERINKSLGLGMDAWDLNFYYNHFTETVKRNPTDVELMQLGNANSEHSRHWYFKGKLIIDGVPMERTLMEIIQAPLKALGDKSRCLIPFRDNAGANYGFLTPVIIPLNPGKPSRFKLVWKLVHGTCTAESHNWPTFVEPFQGAATGAGGRIRDNNAVGRGGRTGIGIVGYLYGNLFIPGYHIPGEVVGKDKPSKYASALKINTRASDGASSYGNEYGEPLTLGFERAFEQIVDGEWIGARKPILFSAGVGDIFDEHLKKEAPEIGMLIVRIGGPAYSIGVGGGSASSMAPGTNTEALDFNSVQRGNGQMANKVARVIRTCTEMEKNNPISSIHDQGAGGPSNVLTELMEPLGGKINIQKIILGDKTMSVAHIWSAEFQEGYGLLIRPERISEFKEICERERVNCEVLGEITGNGNVVVEDPLTGQTPVDLNLEQILTKMPQKTFESTRKPRNLLPLDLPKMTVAQAVKAVFAQRSVGSKGDKVHKADRSVGGKVVQQQCCGIAQIPIANVTIKAQSYFGKTAMATALGEQPLFMLINPKAASRMIAGEMLTNMVSARITNLNRISCRANWMAPAKLPHQGPPFYDAAVSLSEFMIEVGFAPDGGKDSLSMAAEVQGEIVKSPLSLVLTGYAPVEDFDKKLTPDIKRPGESFLGLIDIGCGKNRLGGSALAQACNQLGNECPDVDNRVMFRNTLLAILEMIDKDCVLSLHDRSSGGLITTVAEMHMASRCGFTIYVNDAATALPELFSEELGFVIEFMPDQENVITDICSQHGFPFARIGYSGGYNQSDEEACRIIVRDRGEVLLNEHVTQLRLWWEATSHELEKIQANPQCADAEFATQAKQYPVVAAPDYHLSFIPYETPAVTLLMADKPQVAVLREEGTNGDEEMIAVCMAAGLDPTALTMSDLIAGKTDLEEFQGLILPGGFSYKDVFGSAKGWAASILFDQKLKAMFDRFYNRSDVFSLGVCNGCQLLPQLGFVPRPGIEITKQPRFIENVSRKFESRWTPLEVLKSSAIMFSDMVGSKIPMWLAHREGQFFCPDPVVMQEILDQHLVPLAYIDPFGNRTEEYPFNPNGSPLGIAAICSPNGQHLAIMPHLERCFLLSRLAWKPHSWRHLESAPCLRPFQNAARWCLEHKGK